jgi:histidine triad (HIT) family protein
MDCIFCKIVEGSAPSNKVLETDTVLAFHDINPAAPVHVLLIPKQHIATMNDLTPENASIMGDLALAAQQVAEKLGIKERGYRLINNCNKEGGQVVYHLHVHLLGGKQLGGLVI